jgi:hypothetical protein
MTFLSSPTACQEVLDLVKSFLDWTRTMSENVKKCVAMAMKRFNRGEDHHGLVRYGDTVYCPFDPNLTIRGQKVRFIVDVAADPNSMTHHHFKELGRFISVDLKEGQVMSQIRSKVQDDITTVQGSGVHGIAKLFLYEFFIVRRVSWFFLVNDLSLTFAISLDHLSIPRLKEWAGLYRSADVGCLFRRRKDLGLQLTSFTFQFKHLQLVRCCLLKNSSDPLVRSVYTAKSSRESTFSRTWAATRVLEELSPEVDHQLKFAGQQDRAGLGLLSRYFANPSVRDKRGVFAQVLLNESEKSMVELLYPCPTGSLDTMDWCSTL